MEQALIASWRKYTRGLGSVTPQKLNRERTWYRLRKWESTSWTPHGFTMKILRNILGHGFPALWILKKSGSWGSEWGRNRNWRLWTALSIGGQHKALGNQRPLPDDTGNAGNAPLLWNGCNTKAVVFQLYRIYRPQRPDTLLSGAGRRIPRPLSGAGGTVLWRSTSRPCLLYTSDAADEL